MKFAVMLMCRAGERGLTPWVLLPTVRAMVNRATPNLPSRDLAATCAFYTRVGFGQEYRDAGWLILTRDGVTLEFFPFADLDPATSSFGCCLRLDDVDGFFETCKAAGVPVTSRGWPRLHPLRLEESGLRTGALIDLDGSLLRVIANP